MYYFAYGSNTSQEQMLERLGKCEVIATGFLLNYKLCFQINANFRTVANVVPEKNNKAFGVIYKLNKNQIEKLDLFEGVPNIYERKIKKINLKNNYLLCYTYTLQQTYGLGIPKKEYFLKIKNGFLQNKLDIKKLLSSYNESLFFQKIF